MERVLEKCIMVDYDQCVEYLQAERTPLLRFILDLLPDLNQKRIVDFCSGPGQLADIILESYNIKKIDLVDASSSMHNLAKQRIGFHNKVRCINRYVEEINEVYDVIICINSAHHFTSLEALLKSIHKCSNSNTKILFLDLHRPFSLKDVEKVIQSCYPSIDKSSLFYKDFYNSLRASFSVEEVDKVITKYGYSLKLEKIPDTDLEVWIFNNYEII